MLAMPAPESVDLVRQHIRSVLETILADEQRRQAHVAQLERDGHRIVTGGSSGRRKWKIVDWRTNEVIAEGNDGAAGCEAAWNRLDPNNTWYNIDHIDNEVPLTDVTTPGLPTGLGEALTEWVEEDRASDEEVAEFIGWPVERVRECRDHL